MMSSCPNASRAYRGATAQRRVEMLQSGEELPENALTDPDEQVRWEAERLLHGEPQWHRMTHAELTRLASLTTDRHDLSTLATVARDRGDAFILLALAQNEQASPDVLHQAELSGLPAARAASLAQQVRRGIKTLDEVTTSGSVREREAVVRAVPKALPLMARDGSARVRREVSKRVTASEHREAVLLLAGDEDVQVRRNLLHGEAGEDFACICLFADEHDDDLRQEARDKALIWMERHPENHYEASLLDELFELLPI